MTILTPKEKKRARQIGARQRLRPNTITDFDVPLRNEDDADGNPFLGFDRRIIEEFGLTASEQADNSTTTRVLASNDHGVEPLGGPNVANDSLRAVSGATTKTKTLDGYHMKDLAFGDRVMAGMDAGKLIGNIPDVNIPNIGKGKLPNDTVYTGSDGKIGLTLVPKIPMSHTSGKLKAGRIAGKIPKSNISGVNWDQVDNKPPLATKHYVDQAIAAEKARANRTYQRKP